MKDTKSPASVPSTRSPGTMNPLAVLHERINRMFDDMWGARSLPGLRVFDEKAFPFLHPNAEVAEAPDSFDITMELPGLDEKNIQVDLVDDMVTIAGEKKEEKQVDEKRKMHVTERTYGRFERSFSLPEGVDVSKGKAVFKDGVLKVSFPRTPAPVKSSRKVPVTREG